MNLLSLCSQSNLPRVFLSHFLYFSLSGQSAHSLSLSLFDPGSSSHSSFSPALPADMATVLIKCTPPEEPTLHQRLNGGSVGWSSSRGVQLPVLSLRAATAPTVCWFLRIIKQEEYIGTPTQANRRPRDPRPGKPATQGPPPRQTGDPGTPARANRQPRDPRPGKPATQGPPPMQTGDPGTPVLANRRPRDPRPCKPATQEPRPGKPATQGPPPRQTGDPGNPVQANRRPRDPAQANRRPRDPRPCKPLTQGPPPRQTGDPGTPIICYEKIIIH
ncbi:basic salivary proline-rich protein 1-like isoform X1 [Oncorhynchus masou masou]|uniref:basic salivary proline-rich protein 1-like isoform X1 n=2 Tax=Oncorhynchus masou masou TaxID=90313 RepID=UPI0031845F7D